jgi:hypothetical protein
MKNSLRHILLLFSIFGCFNSFSQDIKVSAVLDSNKIRIGEQTKLDIYVQYDSKLKSIKLQWPVLGDTITGKVEIVSKTAIDSTIPDKNNPSLVLQHQQLIVTAFDSGYFAIPPLKFYVDGDTTNPLMTEALFLEVNTVPTDTSLAKVKDVKPPFEEPFDWKWYLPYAYWGLGAIALVTAIVLIILRLTRKKVVVVEPEKPKVPPHITALETLGQIKASAVWKEGREKEYYSSISDCIRLYIEGRFGVSALELTTDEIVRAFRSQVVDPLSKEKLQQLLVLSDLVKFAKQIPIEQEHGLTLQNAFDFVNGTKREEEIQIEETPVTETQHATGEPTNTEVKP